MLKFGIAVCLLYYTQSVMSLTICGNEQVKMSKWFLLGPEDPDFVEVGTYLYYRNTMGITGITSDWAPTRKNYGAYCSYSNCANGFDYYATPDLNISCTGDMTTLENQLKCEQDCAAAFNGDLVNYINNNSAPDLDSVLESSGRLLQSQRERRLSGKKYGKVAYTALVQNGLSYVCSAMLGKLSWATPGGFLVKILFSQVFNFICDAVSKGIIAYLEGKFNVDFPGVCCAEPWPSINAFYKQFVRTCVTAVVGKHKKKLPKLHMIGRGTGYIQAYDAAQKCVDEGKDYAGPCLEGDGEIITSTSGEGCSLGKQGATCSSKSDCCDEFDCKAQTCEKRNKKSSLSSARSLQGNAILLLTFAVIAIGVLFN